MNTTKKSSLLLFVGILSFSSCMSPLADLSNEDKATGKEVQAKFDEYWKKLENQDLSNIQDFYSESDKFRWTIGRGINSIQTKNDFSNANDLEEFVQTNYGSNSLITMKMTCPKSVRVTDESHARIFMTYKQSMQDLNGIKTNYQGHFMIDMQKEEGEWKFLYGDDQRIQLSDDL